MRNSSKKQPGKERIIAEPLSPDLAGQGVFINPFSDFAFKRFFSKSNSDLALDFMNAILEGERKISYIEMTSSERSGSTRDIRRIIHDAIGESIDNEQVLMEMQRARQTFIKARNVYYAAANIHEQLSPGDETFNLKDVISICITNFIFDTAHPDQVVHTVKLITQETGQVFYNDLLFKYIEIPKFNKPETWLTTRLDYWLFALKNMQALTEIPLILQGDPIFEKLFKIARLSNLNKKEMTAYTRDQIDRITLNVVRNRLKEEGWEEGKQEGMKEGSIPFIAYLLKEAKFSIQKIAALAGVSVDFVKEVKASQAK